MNIAHESLDTRSPLTMEATTNPMELVEVVMEPELPTESLDWWIQSSLRQRRERRKL